MARSEAQMVLWEVILIVAEKPYMARDIARALCPSINTDRVNHYFAGKLIGTGGDLCVGYCNGHIIEMAPPEAYDPKYEQWKLEHLPLLPNQFIYDIKDEDLYQCLGGMMTRAKEVINACDAGREGEVIFREVVRYLGLERKLNISRMWILDTTDDGIRDAFRRRERFDLPKYERLAEAGFTRQRIDWLLGMNCSRYATLCLPPLPEGATGGPQGRKHHAIGRVMTPVLNVVFERTRMVHLWKPSNFYRVYANFSTPTGEVITAQVIAPEGFRYNNSDTQFSSAEVASAILGAMRTGALIWDNYENRNNVEELSPPPFSLVSLQRAANRIMGWSSTRTSRVAQSLYAKHRAITYPRTETDAWPASMSLHVTDVWKKLWDGWGMRAYPGLAELPARGEATLRHFRDMKKGEDHYAITPTGIIPPDRDDRGNILDEFRLWRLIVARFFVCLLPNAKVQACTRIFNYREKLPEELQAKYGRKSADILARYEAGIIVEANWLAFEEVFGNTRGEGAPLAKRLLEVFPDCPAEIRMTNAKLVQKESHAPEYLTEDTLLYYMVRGDLGTASTRAETIEKLHDLGYIWTDEKRWIRTTTAGDFLITLLADGDLRELIEKEGAAVWENFIHGLELGKKSLQGQTGESFIELMRMKVTEYGKKFMKLAAVDELIFCPKSGNLVHEVKNKDKDGNDTIEAFFFPGYLKPGEASPFVKVFNGRPMTAKDYRDILLGGRNGGPALEFYSKKTGRNYWARVVYEQKKRHLKLNFALRGQTFKKSLSGNAQTAGQP